jgi:hypothetical protein
MTPSHACLLLLHFVVVRLCVHGKVSFPCHAPGAVTAVAGGTYMALNMSLPRFSRAARLVRRAI